MGVARATPAGVAPEPLEESLTPSRAILLYFMGPLLIYPFSKRHFVLEGSFRPLSVVLTFLMLGSLLTADGASVIAQGVFLSGDPSENPCPIRGGWLQPGGVLM